MSEISGLSRSLTGAVSHFNSPGQRGTHKASIAIGVVAAFLAGAGVGAFQNERQAQRETLTCVRTALDAQGRTIISIDGGATWQQMK